MKIIKETLDSGLTVILAPMSGMKTIVGMFSVRAGSHYENLENQGISHFLEHMAFKGTARRPSALDIAKEVEGRGGSWNAYTSNEKTEYFVKFSSEYADVVLDILSDMLLCSKLDSEEIEREKGVIIEEIRRKEDDPESLVISWLWSQLLYRDQPAGRAIAGTEESVGKMSRDHFIDFIKSLYTSENSVFCMSGNINNRKHSHQSLYINWLFDKIEDLFGKIEKGAPKIKKPLIIESQVEPALSLLPRDTIQSHLVLGVRAPYEFHHPKNAALDVLETILGGNMSSRLFTEVREKRGLAYSVSTFTWSYSETGNFGVWAGIKKEKVFEAIKAILEECGKLCVEKVSEEELERAKKYIAGISEIQLESSVATANWLSNQWIMKGPIESLSKKIKKMMAVTAEDIQAVAQEIFVNKGLNLAIIGPHQGMEDEFMKILKF